MITLIFFIIKVLEVRSWLCLHNDAVPRFTSFAPRHQSIVSWPISLNLSFEEKKRVSWSVKKSLVRVSGDLHPGDHVLLSLSVEVKSRSILHNYKLVKLSVKILLSSPSLNNRIRNATLYEKNALSVWSWGCLRSNKGEFCVCFEKITDAILPLGTVDAPAYQGRNRGEMGEQYSYRLFDFPSTLDAICHQYHTIVKNGGFFPSPSFFADTTASSRVAT